MFMQAGQSLDSALGGGPATLMGSDGKPSMVVAAAALRAGIEISSTNSQMFDRTPGMERISDRFSCSASGVKPDANGGLSLVGAAPNAAPVAPAPAPANRPDAPKM